MADRNGKTIPAGKGQAEDFRKYCRDVPDFPKKGILFKDITTLLQKGEVFKRAIQAIADRFENERIDHVVCIDARGFLIGSAVAYCLGCGLIPVRKKGKLPSKTISQSYDLEYGQDTLEIHEDAILPGQRVLIVDDVLATGGTAQAVVSLVKAVKGDVVGVAFLMELADLKGREKLQGENVFCLMKF